MKAKLLKIALAIGSDKDKRKKVIYVILMVIFILSLPILVAYGIANGNFEINYTEVELRVKSTYINTDDYVDATTKNNLDLVNWANNAYENKWGYVCGTFGNVLTSDAVTSKANQYPDAVAPYEDFIRKNWVGKRTADCVGLIKGYCWFNAENEKIEYGTNGMPDVDEEALYKMATEKGTLDTMPDIPGLAVWQKGHIGIYVGDGYTVHAANTSVGVVRTRLDKSGWTHWCKVPGITYLEETEDD